ncbi:MAG: polysaccharide export protein [Planctomycetota bacterium]|nr:MAG: polysaccharide export protein [Planctomycetota bacterium]
MAWKDAPLRRSHAAAAALLLLGLTLALPGCVSAEVRQRRVEARQRAEELLKAPPAEPAPYVLQPGDEIAVRFFYNPELDQHLTLRPDGRFSLPLIGEVSAAGKTPEALAQELASRYEPYLRAIDVSVNVERFASQVVYVGGQVRNPGVVPLTPGMTALQAVLAAGGGVDTAEMRQVVVLRDNGDGSAGFLMLDLKSGLRNLTAFADPPLQPKDIVFVPMSAVAEAGQFVRQYINELLPLAKSFNITYQFGSLGLQ